MTVTLSIVYICYKKFGSFSGHSMYHGSPFKEMGEGRVIKKINIKNGKYSLQPCLLSGPSIPRLRNCRVDITMNHGTVLGD